LLWSKETGPLDLHDLFDSQGLSHITASWENLLPETLASDLPQISADGRVISGTGTNPEGDLEAWVVYLDPIETLPGDFNSDGMVNPVDYVVWRNALGTTYTQADYDVWRAHFGKTMGSSASHAAIPEPCTLFMAGLVFAPLAGRYRRSTYSQLYRGGCSLELRSAHLRFTTPVRLSCTRSTVARPVGVSP
jgi:hypothetical protein